MDEAKKWDDKLTTSVSWTWTDRRYTLTTDGFMKVYRSGHNRECLVVEGEGLFHPLTIEHNGAPFANMPSFIMAEATVSSRELRGLEHTKKGQTIRFFVGLTTFLLEWAWEGDEA